MPGQKWVFLLEGRTCAVWYGVGIDLGTSFTAAAVRDTAGVRMVPLSPDIVVPSMATLAPDGHLLTGHAAAEAAHEPGASVRRFKRRLGDPTRLTLGGSSFSAAELMAAQLRDVLTEVSNAQGAPPNSIVLTCPAIWGPYRRKHFAEVPRLAGVSHYRLVTEPEAAATHYSRERRLGDGEVVAVYDLGGGTFDTTILRMRSGDMEIVGTPEGIEHMGGVDFDDTLQAALDERLDGAISALDPEDPAAAAVRAAIRDLCVKAKEDLSFEPDLTLTVPLPTGPREVVVSRHDFNNMIKPSVRLTSEALHRTIASAGISPDDLSAVLLAGGSSRIPLVHQLVSEEFGRPVRVTLHPKHTVSLGAATMTSRPTAMATPPQPPASSPADTTPTTFIPVQTIPQSAPATITLTRWHIAAIAAAVAVVIAVIVTVVLVTTS